MTKQPRFKKPKAIRTTPELALDLSKTHATFLHGDLTVILTWLQHNRRPALVLVPTYALLNPDNVTPCIVPLDMAYMWDEHTGDGRHCATTTAIFMANLGMPPNPRLAFRVTDLIREHLGDLLSCPPMPAVEQVEVAFATLTNSETGQVTQSGITEDV